MTAHDTHLPDTPAPRSGATSGTPVTRASRDKGTVIVWRITADTVGDPDTAGNSGAGDSPLTARLARHLVAIYSDVHGTVIDFDDDSNLRHAAEATGRTYSTITEAADLGPESRMRGPAALILLRWPRPSSETAESDASSLLSRCQRQLADDGSTIVVVTATQPGNDGTTYRVAEQVLLPAAQTAGLRHLHDIVPIQTDERRDAFTYATDPHTAGQPSGEGRKDAVTTLVIFGHPRPRP